MPKEENVVDPSKFHPISLRNVIYKVISKVIANHLKPLLPSLISPKQFEYVEGAPIMDYVILTEKALHSLKSSRFPGMLLKLDMSKATDKLS